MRRAKKLSNKLMAALLSMAMLLTTILPGMPVYAAEAGIEADRDGTLSATDSDDEISDETSDENVSDSEIQDENVSDSKIPDEDVSDSETPDENVSDSETTDENASDSETPEGTDEEVSGEEADSGETSDEEAIMSLDAKVSAVTATEFSNVGGWNESIYAEIAGVEDADVTEVSYSGPVSGQLEGEDFEYLVRDIADNKNESTGEGVRIDIPGLKAGTYTLTVKVGDNTITKDGIEVTAYDRSGYAHFNYTSGVGAYNDDGTLKKNAIVIYVTDDNKNSVKISYNNSTVAGIGNIFSSSSNIVRTLAQNNIPLVVRFVGTVSETGLYERGAYDARYGDRLINGLSKWFSEPDENGEMDGENGHMCYIRSGKDVTLEGIGYDATIDGWGFSFIAENSSTNYGKSFEVRNLIFINTPEDAVGMEGQQSGSTITSSVERCWIHNNSLYCPNIKSPAAEDKYEGDGSIDFKKGQYLTCSYNFFDGCHKTHLVGGGNSHLQYNITFHHNHWYMCNSRGPLSRNANIHMYNNFVDMQRDYAQNVRASAYIFSEYNLFYASSGAQNVDTSTAGNAIKSYNDSFSSIIWKYTKGTIVTNKSDYVENGCQYAAAGIQYDKFDTDPSLSYIPGNNYELQTDFTQLRKVIASQTGVQKREPKTITDVIESDYSVIDRRDDATVKEIDSLPQTFTSVKTTSKGYAFKVDESFDLNIEYADAVGVLVNAAGENLLEGNGSVQSLPAGTYMIQSADFIKAGYSTEKGEGTPSVFNDITIKNLEITGGTEVAEYTLYFDSNGGSEVEPVTIYSNKKYEITQVSTREGHDFAGWYDAKEGGNKVSYIDGSTLTGNITVYAHWNKQGAPYTLSLDCSKDLDSYVDSSNNITSLTTVNGFTIHALEGGVGEAGNENPKYYMTLKSGTPKTLGTNGVLIDNKSIPGNEDGLLKSIEFTAKGPGVLTVEMALSGSPANGGKYNIVLSRKSPAGSLEEVVNHSITSGTTKMAFKFGFDEAGTYYLYPTGDKGVVYYTLNVQGFEDEDEEEKGGDQGGDDGPINPDDPGNPNDPVNPDDPTDPDSQSGIKVEGLEGPFYYTGAKIIPDITVKDYDITDDDGEYGKVLTPGVDYTVKYSNNVKASTDPSNKAGKATVTVTGKGNYAGKDANEKFEIIYADNYEGSSEELLNLKGAKISKIAPVSYRGTDWYPAFTLVKDGVPTEYYYLPERDTYETKAGYAIKANWSLSNNLNKGTATLLLTGAPDNKGKATTVKKTFKINPVDISKADVDIDIDEENAVYSVKGSTPNVKVTLTYKFDGFNEQTVELKPGIDYTVKYSSNKKAGPSVGKVVIVGKGNYTKKTQPKTFTINKLDMSELPIAVSAYEGVKTDKVKATVLDAQGNPLKATEYTVNVYKEDGETKYSSPKLIKGDTIVIVAEAKSNAINLEGKTEPITLKVGANIGKAKFKLKKDSNNKPITKTYTGKAIELGPEDLEVTMTGVSGNLAMGEDGDYIVVGYTNNINKGTATAYIQGTGEYGGTNKVKFKIVAKTVKFVDEN